MFADASRAHESSAGGAFWPSNAARPDGLRGIQIFADPRPAGRPSPCRPRRSPFRSEHARWGARASHASYLINPAPWIASSGKIAGRAGGRDGAWRRWASTTGLHPGAHMGGGEGGHTAVAGTLSALYERTRGFRSGCSSSSRGQSSCLGAVRGSGPDLDATTVAIAGGVLRHLPRLAAGHDPPRRKLRSGVRGLRSRRRSRPAGRIHLKRLENATRSRVDRHERSGMDTSGCSPSGGWSMTLALPIAGT